MFHPTHACWHYSNGSGSSSSDPMHEGTTCHVFKSICVPRVEKQGVKSPLTSCLPTSTMLDNQPLDPATGMRSARRLPPFILLLLLPFEAFSGSTARAVKSTAPSTLVSRTSGEYWGSWPMVSSLQQLRGPALPKQESQRSLAGSRCLIREEQGSGTPRCGGEGEPCEVSLRVDFSKLAASLEISSPSSQGIYTALCTA